MPTRYAQYMPGFKPGCLPRRDVPGEHCPLFSEHIRVIPRQEADKFVGLVTLKPYAEILNQGRVGSCASESSSGALSTCRDVAGLPHITVNPYFVYHHVSGGRDQGSTIGDNLSFLREKGVVPESVYPRSRGWQAKPPAEAYEAALALRILEYYDIRTLDEVITALVKGFPVVYGANGHAVYKCAHVPNTGLDVNSWGTQWEDGGFGVWVPYSGMQLRYGVFAIRTVTNNESLFDL